MAKWLYFVLLAAVIWKVHADQDGYDQDITPDENQNNQEIKCGKYYAQYPNPEDCGSYIVCQNGQKSIKSCPTGEHYNFQTIRCVKPCEAYCNKTLSCQCRWSTCGLDDVCFQEKIVGGCRPRVARYFFNKRTGQCERFGYSGCMGNQNNFETLEECQRKCRKGSSEKWIRQKATTSIGSSGKVIRQIATAKPIPGFRCLTMNGRFPNPDNCRTYFQCTDGKPDLKACESGLHYSDKSKTCEKPCDAYCDKSLSCKCKWPTCGLDDLCFLPPEVGPCRAGFYNYYFNRRTGECEKFLYGGCRGNKNNFQKKEDCEKACAKTKPKPKFYCLFKNGNFPNPDNCETYYQCTDFKPEPKTCEAGLHFSDQSQKCEKPCDSYCDKSLACQCKWPTCGLKDLCHLLPETGPCRAGFRNYYFNRRTGQCDKFFYGGCLGNENNFKKKEDCEKTCSKSEEPPVTKYVEPTLEESTERPVNEYVEPISEESTERPVNEYDEPTSEESTERPVNEYDEPTSEESTERPVNEYVEPFSDESTERPFNEYDEPTSEESTESPIDEIPDLPEDKLVQPHVECLEDGVYAHPRTCRSFVTCSKGVPKLQTCPEKLHFNNKTKRCETPCEAQCDRTIACKCKWPTCGTNALCFLPAKPGPCRGKFERFHFDKRSGECKAFDYGGCKGNENNFVSRKSCEHKCKHSLDICKLPYKTGPCKGKFERFFFNHKEGKCQTFTFGGCKGNHNNFKTLEECEMSCVQKKELEEYPLVGCPGNDKWGDAYNCSVYYECENGSKLHKRECPKGQHFNNALKRCTAPCDAFCEPAIACECKWPTCKKGGDFTCAEDGLFKHSESCSSYVHCVNGQRYDRHCPTGLHFNERTKQCETPQSAQCQEPKDSAENICTLPAEIGPCKESLRNYFFNHEKGECQQFIYGGCKGNANNFETKEECERRCLKSADSEEGSEQAAFLCTLPEDKGQCDSLILKYYFNRDEGRCQKFVYSGCGGNLNNFNSKEECERFCLRGAGIPSSDPLCAEDGVRSDFESCGRFIRCSNGQKQIKSCPPGLHFNEATKQCDSPCEARCDPRLAMDCGWPMGAENSADSECAEDGVFPDIGSCSRFIQCSDGKKTVKRCPPLLHFNEKTKQCDSPCDAQCDASLAYQCGWPMGSELSGNCGEHERYSFIGAACQRNCKNYKDWIVPCRLMTPGCICDDGYVRNSQGMCIPKDECETDNYQAEDADF